jgi:hypothetical protein
MEFAVGININAKPDIIWALLTNADDFPRWNTTVQRIEGRIAPGETIKLKVAIAPERTFKLKVVTFVPNQRMVWQDGAAPMFQGIRRYTLTPKNDGSTDFSMSETFSGLMLPMIGGSLPDFRQSFEQYAVDLKKAAEQRSGISFEHADQVERFA